MLETVLVIEDNPYNQEVIERGIRYVNSDLHVKVKENAGSAITWLTSCDINCEKTGDHTCKPELIFWIPTFRERVIYFVERKL